MIRGVYCASVTPVKADLSPDVEALTANARALIADGCDGVALLGTTGEANSFSLAERRTVLEAAVQAVGADRLMPGTGVNALPETIELTRHALSLGVSRVVMLPPSYYKGVSDEGLFRAYAQVIETLADDSLRVVLYHIPQVSGVAISHDLIERLSANGRGHQGLGRQDREHAGDDRPLSRVLGPGRRRSAAFAADGDGWGGVHHRDLEQIGRAHV